MEKHFTISLKIKHEIKILYIFNNQTVLCTTSRLEKEYKKILT